MRKIFDKLPNWMRTCIRKLVHFFRIHISTIFCSFNLTKLAQIYHTDKWGSHFYTPNYQFYFCKYKFKRIKLLEIGVGGYDEPDKGGNSLRMWKKYFPFGKIYSIDIYDKSKLQENRIEIFQGSQVDEQFLERLMDDIGKPDIIIDDGSHLNSHVITTFKLLFPHLKNNGIYVIEDTETSYRNRFGGDELNLSNQQTTMNFFKSFPDRINSMEFHIPDFQSEFFETGLHSIHFYHNLIFVYKNEHLELSSNFRYN